MTRATAEHWFAILAFPALITVAVGGAAWLLGRGMVPEAAVAIAVGAGYLFIGTFERVFPLHRSWLRSHGDLGEDVGLFATNAAVANFIQPVVFAGAVALYGWLAVRTGSGIWPHAWSWPAQLVLALVIGEFFEYSFHRLMHEVPVLWRFHATHHSATRLYWLNAVRFHPIDLFLVSTVRLSALLLLGCGQDIVALVLVFSGVHGSFQHANLPVRLGPLNWVFSMAELHRWHHSKNVAEANRNYGGNLICWDVLFGTRFLPADREPPADVGIADMPAFPHGLLTQIMVPFRWERVRRQASASPGARP
jgi:sterol desaturase/sphingolipid hydroxylase (fatty acid hydroxylase superfamily)